MNLLADIQHSTRDVATGLVVMGGLLVITAYVTRRMVGLLCQAAGVAFAYFGGAKRIPNVQAQQVMSMVFLGLVLGLLLAWATPEKWAK